VRNKQILAIPGPTPVPPEARLAMARPMINHRGSEYTAMQREIVEGLQYAFQTGGDVLIFPASGTGGLEAAVVNTLSPGDRVLSGSIGAFGDRFADIAEAHGAIVDRIPTEWGSALDPEVLRARLAEDRDHTIKAVLLTHNETSTGVTNDIRALAEVIRDHGALVLVDSISGLLAADLQTDAWGLDVVVAGSQKAFMIPPGMTFVSVSERAWAAHRNARMPRYYFDFTAMKKYMEKGQTPYTPAVSLLYGLQTTLRMLREEGLPECFARHARLGAAVRAGAQALGLRLLADPRYASPAVTSIYAPEGIDPKQLRQVVRERYGVVLAGGQGKLADRIFRIGHLGYVGENDIIAVMSALERGLGDLGVRITPGAGIAATQQALAA
jgi:aspartate aminotransferase-like enzyme